MLAYLAKAKSYAVLGFYSQHSIVLKCIKDLFKSSTIIYIAYFIMHDILC